MCSMKGPGVRSIKVHELISCNHYTREEKVILLLKKLTIPQTYRLEYRLRGPFA